MTQSLKEKMMDVLTRSNFLTKEQLDEAIEAQKKTGKRLSEVLTMMGYITQKDLVIVLSQSLNVPPINLSKVKINSEIVKIIPRESAEKYQALVVSKIGKVLTVAMVDPLNVLAIDELKVLTNYELKIVVAGEKELKTAINTYYSDSDTTNERIRTIIDDAKDMNLEIIEDIDSQEKILNTAQLLKDVEGAPIVKITNMLLAQAIKHQASDILIEPQEKVLRIRYRLDGILKEFPAPPKHMEEAIVSRIKVLSVLNIAEHRLPQDGRFKIKIADREVDFRVSIMPTSHGEKVALRVLDKTAVVLDLDRMGFEPGPLKNIKELAMEPHGLMLVCGPTGSGKSTTLYSILKYVDDPEKNICSAEDPVEYQLEGINQVNVNPDVGLTFCGALRSFLRQDPDVIMVGEIRDTETLDISIKAALTGHLVLSTLHTTEAAGAVTRMVNMGIEPFLITSSCIMVCAQRLIRRICPECKEGYPIQAEVRKKFKIGDQYNELYKGKGCKACQGTGYKGRIGLCEVLVMTPEVRDLIMIRAQENLIKAKAREQGMVTLREHGVIKSLKGITTLEEVTRLTADD
ncbi:MAG: Flp pilus assembly complex ATPase component TadA [Candidatus Omnitrophica bacterium]|nr:Flp pilus assembly complex ATPase component TadA [Candidatus Omnitrophota bacterium]